MINEAKEKYLKKLNLNNYSNKYAYNKKGMDKIKSPLDNIKFDEE